MTTLICTITSAVRRRSITPSRSGHIQHSLPLTLHPLAPLSTHSHSLCTPRHHSAVTPTHTHSLSLILVAVMKSKEFKTKTSHAHSLILSHSLHHSVPPPTHSAPLGTCPAPTPNTYLMHIDATLSLITSQLELRAGQAAT